MTISEMETLVTGLSDIDARDLCTILDRRLGADQAAAATTSGSKYTTCDHRAERRVYCAKCIDEEIDAVLEDAADAVHSARRR